MPQAPVSMPAQPLYPALDIIGDLEGYNEVQYMGGLLPLKELNGGEFQCVLETTFVDMKGDGELHTAVCFMQAVITPAGCQSPVGLMCATARPVGVPTASEVPGCHGRIAADCCLCR